MSSSKIKDLEERLALLEEQVKLFPKRGKYYSFYESKLIETALNFARASKLGYAVLDNERTFIVDGDLKIFEDQIKHYAYKILLELSIEDQ